jgi:transcriptional regulator with XRE-family HTH domain
LKDARKRKGLSTSQVGERVGVSHQSISNWETGARTPNEERLQAWARALGLRARSRFVVEIEEAE